jgi:hypothetical protein
MGSHFLNAETGAGCEGHAPSLAAFAWRDDSMTPATRTQTSPAWTWAEWILTALSAAFMFADGVAKAFFPPGALLLGEMQRLGEANELVRLPFSTSCVLRCT